MVFIKKYYLQLLASSGFLLLIIVMIVQSMHVITMIKNKQKEFKQEQLDYALAQEFLGNIHEFQQNSEYIDQNKDWMNMFLPDEDDEKIKLFATLEQLSADTNNVDITLSVNKNPKIKKEVDKNKKSSQKNKEQSNKEKALNIDIELIGDYNTILAFLEKLENLKYLANVKKISMQKIEDVTKEVKNEQGVKTEITYKDVVKAKIDTMFYLNN